MNGGVRAALAILVILGGIVLVIYAIQGMWPIGPLGGRGVPEAERPGKGFPEAGRD